MSFFRSFHGDAVSMFKRGVIYFFLRLLNRIFQRRSGWCIPGSFVVFFSQLLYCWMPRYVMIHFYCFVSMRSRKLRPFFSRIDSFLLSILKSNDWAFASLIETWMLKHLFCFWIFKIFFKNCFVASEFIIFELFLKQ